MKFLKAIFSVVLFISICSCESDDEYYDIRDEGIAFLEANVSKEGVIETSSGLQYKVIKKISGIKPSATDKVTVHYHGTTIHGEVFDSSVDRGTPSSFYLNQVISGWTEGLQLMGTGSKYVFYIPYELAYGEQGSGNTIKPFMALIFEVELISVN